jgi:predicted PurR-regulated permease PerM
MIRTMKNNLRNNSAAVLLTVIVLITLLSVIVATLISTNISQLKMSQGVVDDIKTEYLADSEFKKFHQEMTTLGTNSLNAISDYDLDDKEYSFSSVSTTNSSTPNNTWQLTFNMEY